MSALQSREVQQEASWTGWALPFSPVARLFNRLANSPHWGVYLSAAIGFVLIAGVTIGELSGLIQGMQLPGEPSAALRRLSSSPDQVREVVAGWQAFAEAAGPEFTTARVVAGAQLLTDTLFVFGYVTVAALLLLRVQVRNGLKEAVRSGALRRSLAAGLSLEAAQARAEQASADTSEAFNFVLDLTFLGVLGLGFVSWMENGLTWRILTAYWDASPASPAGDGWGLAILALRGFVLAKWALLALIAIPFVTLGLRFALYKLPEFMASVRLVRVQLVLVVAFVVLVMLPVQIPDVILRMTGAQFALVIALTAGLGLVSWAFSRRLVLHQHWRRVHPEPPPLLTRRVGATVLGVISVVCLSVGGFVALVGGRPWPALVPMAFSAVVVGLGWLIGEVPEEPERPTEAGIGGDILPRLMGAGALAVLGLAIVRATVGPMVYTRRWEEFGRIGWGLAAAAAGQVLFAVLHRLDDREEEADWTGWWRGSLRTITIVSAIPLAVLWYLVLANPWEIPVTFGALGVLVAFLTGLTLVTGGLLVLSEWHAERFGVPRIMRLMRFRTVPVVILLFAWSLVAGRVNGHDHLDVRVLEGSVVPGVGLTLDDAFTRWLDANGPAASGGLRAPGGPRQAVPLVLVAAAGGGIRAATWTGLALDCLFEPHPILVDCKAPTDTFQGHTASRMFLGSGVSGGSLGLAEYVTQVYTHPPDPSRPAEDWVADRLGDDYLSPAVAWGLFAEFPRVFLGYHAMDRAEVMERTWERSWGSEGAASPFGRGFLAMQSDPSRPEIPLVLMNGSSVRDGCLVNGSVLDVSLDDGATIGRGEGRLNLVGGCQSLEPFAEPSPAQDGVPVDDPNAATVLPGAFDLLDFLCAGDDVAISTAVMLSARFPGASPSGRLTACDREKETGVKFVVDGGYIEPSGAETLMALWPHIEALIDANNSDQDRPCVVPFFVQIDNRYLKPPAPPKTSSPNELLAPIAALRHTVLASRAQKAQSAAALAFARPYETRSRLDGDRLDDRFAYLVPLAHPGVEAPLGWSLSDAAKEDMRTQVVGERNLAEIREIRSWLSGDLTCG